MLDFLSEYWRVLFAIAIMLLVWWRLSRRHVTLNLVGDTAVPKETAPLFSEVLPELAEEVERLLLESDEKELVTQVPALRIVERCRCGDDFCSTFYVQPKPEGAYGPDHRNVVLDPPRGMLVLDVVGNKIACIEVLYRDDIREKLHSTFP
jgi:hypothetical protein